MPLRRLRFGRATPHDRRIHGFGLRLWLAVEAYVIGELACIAGTPRHEIEHGEVGADVVLDHRWRFIDVDPFENPDGLGRSFLRNELSLSDGVECVLAARGLSRAELLECGQPPLLVGRALQDGRDVGGFAREAPNPNQEPECDEGEHSGHDQPHVADGGLEDACDDPNDGQRQADEPQHLPVHPGLFYLLESLRGVFRGCGDLLFWLRHSRSVPRRLLHGKPTRPRCPDKPPINAREIRDFANALFQR